MDLNLNNLNKMEISLEKFGTICAWILLSISLYSTISIVQLMNLIFFNGIPKNGEESVIFGVIGIFGGFVAFTKSSIISYQAIDGIKKRNPVKVKNFYNLMTTIFAIIFIAQIGLLFAVESKNDAAILIIPEIIILGICGSMSELEKRFEKAVELGDEKKVVFMATASV